MRRAHIEKRVLAYFAEMKAGVVLDALEALYSRIEAHSTLDVSRIEDAIEVLLEAQKSSPDRQLGVPYVVHPMQVALRTMELIPSPSSDQIISAILHDVVEDEPLELIRILGGEEEKGQELAYHLISERFGQNVSDTVRALTNPDFSLLTEKLKDSGDIRSEEMLKNVCYSEHVLGVLRSSTDASVIKMADFWENGFSLKKIEDQRRLDHLKRKYSSVIESLPSLIQALDASHPLYPAKGLVLRKVNEQWSFFFGSQC